MTDFKIMGDVEIGGDAAQQAARIRKDIQNNLKDIKLTVDVSSLESAVTKLERGRLFDNAFRRAIRGISLLRQSLKKLEDSFTRVNDEASTLALNIAGLGIVTGKQPTSF